MTMTTATANPFATIESTLAFAKLGARPTTERDRWEDYEYFKAKLWAAAQSCDEHEAAIRRLLTILGL